MIENTLRFGVYGKVEQKKRLGGDSKLHVIEESYNEDADDNESPRKTNRSITKGGMPFDELERLRKENAEL
jgi:hypothetical protein